MDETAQFLFLIYDEYLLYIVYYMRVRLTTTSSIR